MGLFGSPSISSLANFLSQGIRSLAGAMQAQLVWLLCLGNPSLVRAYLVAKIVWVNSSHLYKGELTFTYCPLSILSSMC
jgi:hypothetical protein